MSLLMKPTARVLRRRMPWARGSGLKPRRSIAAWTFSRVARRTVSGAFRERETVPTETPAARATSRIVAGLAPLPAMARLPSTREPGRGYQQGLAMAKGPDLPRLYPDSTPAHDA